MEINKSGEKRSTSDRSNGDEEDKEPEDDNKKKKASTHSVKEGSIGGPAQPAAWCQVVDCTFNMSDAKLYHRRHKVCEFHAKAPQVLVAGIQQRFCQQCSKFHELSEFDDAKRSCRRHLHGHNKRRRKSYDLPAEGTT